MKSHSKYHVWCVASQDASGKLVSFLKNQLGPQFSSRAIKRAIELNLCKVNGRIERFASKQLTKGDRVELAKDWEKSSKPKNDCPIAVLYEDNSFLIINKLSGMTCGPNLIAKCTRLKSVCLLHRLDRDTTGILILVKKESVRQEMIQAFKNQAVEKTYIAVVDKKIKKDSGKIENHLGPKKRFHGQVIYGEVQHGGKYACTYFRCLKRGKDYSVLECRPITGRTHQIRVHLASIGHPILGDAQYCRQFQCQRVYSRHLLHSWKIEFTHPVNQKKVCVEAPIPTEVQDLM